MVHQWLLYRHLLINRMYQPRLELIPLLLQLILPISLIALLPLTELLTTIPVHDRGPTSSTCVAFFIFAPGT